ncbi:DUF2326 domain-containing protein [Draconibacterium mangrovi]|uniref:DUF2326 domain-containing protein n=1 Tax=Draconibacterium mangrovi TaxID=2697469 RepID=UPI0013D8A826|nr:DUF2326 domain-containing protein [Draconibacterium mangrovi]
MRLVELRANKESFNTIPFNPTGVSIISAIKETDEKRKTFNSVGKSLTIALIHFCLGSNPYPEFEEKLKEWEFSLDFKIKGVEYTARRACENQSEIFLNEEKLTLDKFRKNLENELFDIPEDSKYISFRGLISRFIRPYKYSYISYDKYIKAEDKTITESINNAFLLGLDINRILKKSELKESLDKVEQQKKNIEKDEILKAYFEGEDADEDIDIKIVELESTLKKLETNLSNFKIAEDYAQIELEADALSAEIKRYSNKAAKYENALKNIERSLEIKPDVSKQKIKKLYKEAKFQLSDMIIKRLDDLEVFNNKIISNRIKRLMDDRKKFVMHLHDIQANIKILAKRENEKIQYLNAHGALDEYTKLNKQLSDTDKKLTKLNQFRKLKGEYKDKIEGINKDFIDENTSTRKYLNEIKSITNDNIIRFKSFVEQFYDDKKCGITILSNENVNKKRFEINAKIADDAGDSVNEVKLFCYDWTILTARNNHNVDFLFHDSRILDGMDPRQISTLFTIANKECKNGFQYIISINQNVTDSLENELTPEEMKEYITDNIVLELSDKSDENKLLGIQVDLNYDL